ncbi:putative hydroxypyruvate isomerase [Lingula anatina]|uniref:Putative hydroxypyruvate isomerase n=1 Tax=Lingula anatina TaxID=7574 RepID=A0A1S3JC54_LINAN|nr:putative hydroxypyruvate isomerase [Lingula anatina]|eukprot:XP_013407464.1 putative hydroxypyruvate isomerase [Lingula anatina]
MQLISMFVARSVVRHFHYFSTSSAKMPLKFAANISMLFQEIEGLENRYKAAKEAGFKAVECTFPYEVAADKLAEAKEAAGIEHVLINAWPGDLKGGDIGIAAISSRRSEFKEKLETSIQYAKALGCKRMHVMAGRQTQFIDTAMKDVYLENIGYAAERLQKEGILCLIEAVNSKISLPGYFMDNYEKAVECIKNVNHPNLKLQLDIFHLQIMHGNLTGMIKEYMPCVGHMQIAQVPDRHEPNTDGEINYKYVFKLLEEVGYDGWIGLEYKPKGNTVEGLKWIQEMGYQL